MSEESSEAPKPSTSKVPRKNVRKWVVRGIIAAIALTVIIVAIPWIYGALTTISTDDAYVNSHVTFTAARVPGQVMRVLVDDNNRVRAGQVVVELDKKPYEVIVATKQAAVDTANSDLRVAEAQVRANEALARSLRWKLQHAMESVKDQIAALHTAIASLESARTKAALAKSDLDRATQAGPAAVSAEILDHRRQDWAVAESQVSEALEGVYQIRASLGLPAQPEPRHDLVGMLASMLGHLGGLFAEPENLAQVPDNLVEIFSSVRQAQAELMQAASQIGVIYPMDKLPSEMLADFLKRDPSGDIDKIYAKLLKDAPAVKQAQAKIVQAESELAQANLNLSYCTIKAEIDGVVTRRNVNPGNNVVAGQELMAIRSLKEVWVDANFKETELGDLRIGQPVDLRLDMYGRHKEFKGRISGFTMGTGSTLALLPAQNATGNFVKVVQRLPVRIEIEGYDADKDPLFVGLSVEPRVHYREPCTGPNAGKVLQPFVTEPSPPAPATKEAGR